MQGTPTVLLADADVLIDYRDFELVARQGGRARCSRRAPERMVRFEIALGQLVSGHPSPVQFENQHARHPVKTAA